NPDGTFWISTSDGIARYAPTLWRTPAAAKEADPASEVITSIAEDSRHTLWFLAASHLLMRDPAEHWTKYYLPKDSPSPTRNTDAIHELADGRMVICLSADSFLLVFDPRTHTFRRVVAPAGRRLGRVARRAAGGVWVQIFAGTSPEWHLEVFDGDRF